ncbi:MAG: MipA/OmpV family protein [Betaproteobacteria bacterium]|jgi:outer membrane protein|nr:MipA/OmpV family protein [Betaproteobacteria bacterium]
MNQDSFRSAILSFSLPFVASISMACAAQTASAQERPRNLVSLGAISLPEFEGSADQALRPFALARVDFGRYGNLRVAGQTVLYSVLAESSRWAVGPLLSMRAARDDSVEDPVVRRLRKVDGTVEAGAFVEYRLTDTLMRGDRLSLGLDVKGGEGNQLTWGVLYQGPKSGNFQYGIDLRMTYANDKHMETYFSIDADNSARSGLPTYRAAAGLKSTTIGFTGSYDLSQQWTLIARVGFTRLAADAADSPIVRLRGDANATAVGLAVGYRF